MEQEHQYANQINKLPKGQFLILKAIYVNFLKEMCMTCEILITNIISLIFSIIGFEFFNQKIRTFT